MNDNQLKDSIVYHFKVKLIKPEALPAGCGNIAFAVLQKFQIVTTDSLSHQNKNILLIQPCPEMLGDHFFEANKYYDVFVMTNNTSGFNYAYVNNYGNDKLLTFWVKRIFKINN